MTIVQNILKIANEHKINNQQLCKILNTNSSKIYDWKVGKSKPSADDVFTLADYFNVSIDYLVGRTDKTTNTHYINNDINNGNIMQDIAVVDSAIHFVNDKDKDLTKEEKEILDIYRSLNICDKSTFLNFILDMRKEKSC